MTEREHLERVVKRVGDMHQRIAARLQSPGYREAFGLSETIAEILESIHVIGKIVLRVHKQCDHAGVLSDE